MVAGCLGLAPAAAAQGAPLEPGRETRLFVRGVAAPFEGTLTAVDPDALAVTLQDGSSFTFQAAQLERSEVLVSGRNTLRGAIMGGAVGLGVGVGLVVTSSGSHDGFGDDFEAWRLIVPAAAGAAAGSLVGYAVRTPRWVPGLMPSAASSADFGLSWSVPLAS